jgi:hypothetical protein
MKPSPEWELDCHLWRGEVLTGRKRHWCPEWDGLPVDETCREWPCGCWLSMSWWERLKFWWGRFGE